MMYAIRAKKIVPVTAPDIPDGVLLVSDGKIAAVGSYSEVTLPEGCEVKDYSAYELYPGLIDCASHLGINMEPYNYMDGPRDGEDPTETISPKLHAADGINPYDKTFEKVRSYGFTTCFAALGHTSLIEGYGTAIKLLDTDDLKVLLIPETEQLNCTFGMYLVAMNVQMKKPPMSTPAMMTMLRDTFDAAKAAAESEEALKSASPVSKALIPVMKRERKVRLNCQTAQDMMRAVNLMEEYNLDYVIDGGMEAWKIPDFLTEHQAKVVLYGIPFGPMQTTVGAAYQMDFHTAGILSERGLLAALSVDAVTDTCRLPMLAGVQTAYGLKREDAIRAITLGGAEVLGISDRTGSLEVGKDADFMISTGDVLCNFSKCIATFVNGIQTYQA